MTDLPTSYRPLNELWFKTWEKVLELHWMESLYCYQRISKLSYTVVNKLSMIHTPQSYLFTYFILETGLPQVRQPPLARHLFIKVCYTVYGSLSIQFYNTLVFFSDWKETVLPSPFPKCLVRFKLPINFNGVPEHLSPDMRPIYFTFPYFQILSVHEVFSCQDVVTKRWKRSLS